MILCDPPWYYRERVQHGGRDQPFDSGAREFYETVTLRKLMELPVRKLIDPQGAIMFMWCTGPVLADGTAQALMRKWGFIPKQVPFVWAKQSADKVVTHVEDNGDLLIRVSRGKDQVNPGSYTVTSCEFVLVGVARRIPRPRGARNIRQLLIASRTEHSAKPVEVHRRIEKMFPKQTKIELFARRRRSGWRVWGKGVGRGKVAA